MASSVAMAALATVGVALAFAQQPAPVSPAAPVRFEVASVKPNRTGDTKGSMRRQPGGRVNAVNMPLRVLISFAYEVPPIRLMGGPDWIGTDRFDIVAKLEGDPPPAVPGLGTDGMAAAMRTLLADRFNLEVHRETREVDIYALVMARADGTPGPALKASTQDCSSQASKAAAFCGMQGSAGMIRFGGMPLSLFAANLAGAAGRVVIDRTGLAGNWDFELSFAAEARNPAPPGIDAPAVNPNAASIFAAIQEQLGLKLEPARGPVDVVMIDRIERPVTD